MTDFYKIRNEVKKYIDKKILQLKYDDESINISKLKSEIIDKFGVGSIMIERILNEYLLNKRILIKDYKIYKA
jgi:hypothetical protein